jgi:mRNA-degrading endonuclease RelE of RelBE toxin-antitoxin system
MLLRHLLSFETNWQTMPSKVIFPAPFKKDLRKLSRKYPAVLDELERLSLELQADERPGDKIPNVGYDVYKVRLKNPSAQKGKSGGFRVIYYIYVVDKVYYLSIYSKSQQIDISPEEIRAIIEEILPPPSETEE